MNTKSAQFSFNVKHALLLIIWLSVVTNFIFVFSLQKNKEIKTGLAAIPGDCGGPNGVPDGFVDLFDYGNLSRSFGLTQGQTGFNAACDFYADSHNIIDLLDYGILAQNFGRIGPSNTPSPRPSITGSPTPTLPLPPTGGGMWITRSEIMALPTSGPAWANIRNAAYGSWGSPDLQNQDNKYGIPVLAGAFVYAKTGDASLRSKVRDGIMAAKRTMDETSEWQTTNGALSLGRQLSAFVIAADVIDLKSFDSTADNEFRNYLRTVRTQNVGTHGRWKSINYTCENVTANWGSFACASVIAASIYVGDTPDVQRKANIIRAYFGERQYYPSDAPGVNGYFQPSAAWDTSWPCNVSSWTGINPPCTKSGVNVDGVLVDDADRGGSCCTLVGDGNMYTWESLQGIFMSAELLYRTGNAGNPYSWSNNALKRAMDYVQRQGWNITSPAHYVPWLANKRYGTSYPATSDTSGRNMAWGDWLYQR